MGLKNFGHITDEFVAKIRQKFLQQYEHELDQFYPEDVEQILNEQWFIKRFVIAAYKNEIDTIDKMVSALRWRKEKRLRETGDNYFPKEFFEIGAIFEYETDKNGIPTLYLRLACFVYVPELIESIKKYVIHYIFKIDERTRGNGFAVFCDFQHCGYSMIQYLDLLRYFLTSVHYYFPAAIDFVYNYEVPWYLKTGWSMVKYWIPEKRRDMFKFVNKADLFLLFDEESVPKYLNGKGKKSIIQVPENCTPCIEFGMYELGLPKEDCMRLVEFFEEYMKTNAFQVNQA